MILKKVLVIRTCFEEHNLVVLRELHKTGHHLCKLNYLLDHVRQLSGTLKPLVLVRLQNVIFFLKKSVLIY